METLKAVKQSNLNELFKKFDEEEIGFITGKKFLEKVENLSNIFKELVKYE